MNKSLFINKICALVAISAAVVSCGFTGFRGNGDDNYYSSFSAFENEEWSYYQPIEFFVDTLRDSIATGGTLLLSLRHTNGYEYSNLWIELSYQSEDTIKSDTFNIVLADDYGRWRGSGIGPSLQISDTLYRNFTIRKGMKLHLRHIMRPDTLTEIEQIGIVYLPSE